MVLIGDKRNTPNSRLKVTLVIISIVLSDVILKVNGNEVKLDKETCINGHEKIENGFSWVDYVVLGTMLVVSCGIGLFYGFIGSKQKTSSDFLLGGSSMGTLPMAMSLAASFVTAIELLGNPAEMYNHGTQFLMICVAFILVVPLTSNLFLPVFMSLRLTSSYEYLAMRFSANTRYFASALYIFQMVLYTSVAVYAPALALSHVTGLNVYLAVTVVYVVCIFYASQGGMKAVIIADTFQASVLIGSIIVVMYLGQKFSEGTATIWSLNFNTERLELFNFNPDPTIRHSFWSVVIGGTFYWTTMFCSNQASIQKYLSVESISQVRTALWTSCFGLIFIYVVNFYTGMLMVTHYRHCDPLKSNEITASDQILPLYVLSTMGHLKGVTGFFVAGIFAASLGTVASALNSLAAVTIQDFVCGAFKMNLPESKGAFWAKCISIVYGAISFALVFIVAELGSIMQVAISFNGMVGGITLGLFSLGMFFPWTNSKGAIFGSILAVALISTMCVGQQIAIASGDLTEDNIKFTSTDKCACFNETASSTTNVDGKLLDTNDGVFYLFRISYIWYSGLGFLITVIVGLTGSFVSGAQDPHDVDWNLLSPPVQKFFLSLSTRNKERLNIPLKVNTNENRNVVLTGVFNLGLDITDENRVKNNVVEFKMDKIRKFSAPSCFTVTL